MEYIPWFVWIVLAGIAFAAVVSVVDTWGKTRRKVAEAAAAPSRVEVLERLDAIDRRLAAIERSLDEIPN